MSTGVEPVEIIDPWLWKTLSTDPTIVSLVAQRISNGAALGSSQTPFITWEMNSSVDRTNASGQTILSNSLFVVKAVGQGGSYLPVLPIAKRINELLADKDVTTENGTLQCRRDRVIRYVELDDNVQYRHLGGIYRIYAHS